MHVTILVLTGNSTLFRFYVVSHSHFSRLLLRALDMYIYMLHAHSATALYTVAPIVKCDCWRPIQNIITNCSVAPPLTLKAHIISEGLRQFLCSSVSHVRVEVHGDPPQTRHLTHLGCPEPQAVLPCCTLPAQTLVLQNVESNTIHIKLDAHPTHITWKDSSDTCRVLKEKHLPSTLYMHLLVDSLKGKYAHVSSPGTKRKHFPSIYSTYTFLHTFQNWSYLYLTSTMRLANKGCRQWQVGYLRNMVVPWRVLQWMLLPVQWGYMQLDPATPVCASSSQH